MAWVPCRAACISSWMVAGLNLEAAEAFVTHVPLLIYLALTYALPRYLGLQGIIWKVYCNNRHGGGKVVVACIHLQVDASCERWTSIK